MVEGASRETKKAETADNVLVPVSATFVLNIEKNFIRIMGVT